jgi:drug/metabolite transporter (DMT)-like permease
MINKWFIYALFSVLALSGSELSQKVALTHKNNISAVTNNFFVWIMQGLGGLVIAFLFHQLNFSLFQIPWLRLLIIGIVYFVGGTLYYTSYKSNSPSISIVLASVSVIISSILGIIFFHESTIFIKFVGIGIILSSIFYLNFQKKIKLDKYNILAILGGLCFGAAYTIDKSFALQMPPAMYLMLMCFSVAFVSFVIKSGLIIKEFAKMNSENYFPMVASAIFGILFNYFTFKSYASGGNVGVVDAINNTTVFIVIILEILILKDKYNLTKKIISSVLAVTGVMLLSFIT